MPVPGPTPATTAKGVGDIGVVLVCLGDVGVFGKTLSLGEGLEGTVGV